TKVFLGMTIGFCLGVALPIAAWRFFDKTVPFTRQSLDFESYSHMKRFVHDVTTFHNGTHDLDTYYTGFTFETSISSSADYFSRVETAIRDSDWKLLDSSGSFRLYVSKWVRSAPTAYRLEIALSFESPTRVSFE